MHKGKYYYSPTQLSVAAGYGLVTGQLVQRGLVGARVVA